MKVTLKRLDGLKDGQEKAYQLVAGNPVFLGRGPDLQIDSTSISRKHVELVLTEATVHLKCLHKNSVYIVRSGSDVVQEVGQGSEAELPDGAEVWFSRQAFKFLVTVQPSSSSSGEEDMEEEEQVEVRPKASTGVIKKKQRQLPEWMGGVKEALDSVAASGSTKAETKGEPSKTKDRPAKTDDADDSKDTGKKDEQQEGAAATPGKDSNKVVFPTVITAADYLDSDEAEEEEKASKKKAAARKFGGGGGAKGGGGAGAAAATRGRRACRYGAACYRKNPQHFEQEAHPGDADYVAADDGDDDNRPECEYGLSCYRKNPDHRRRYKHTRRPQPKRRAKVAQANKPAKKGDDGDFIDDTDEEPVDDTDEDATWEMKDTDEDD